MLVNSWVEYLNVRAKYYLLVRRETRCSRFMLILLRLPALINLSARTEDLRSTLILWKSVDFYGVIWKIKRWSFHQLMMHNWCVVCSFFELAWTQNCNGDYVELSRSQNFSVSERVGRYCGSTRPSRRTVSSSVWIRFRSDANNSTGRGFMASYTSCRFTHFNQLFVVYNEHADSD